MSVESYVRAMPKVELHVHLEGSIRPEILLKLAKRNGVSLPYDTVEGIREWYQFRDFDHFIEIYIAICSVLKTPEDFTEIAYDLGKTLAAQNCRYAEVTWTPSTHCQSFKHFLEILDAVNVGREKVGQDYGIEMRWIPDNSRHIDDKRADEVAEWITSTEAVAGGVVALGLGGPEVGNPPEKFEWTAAIAMGNNVPYNPHAGETVGPESIWGALLVLKAKRIGHGVRAIEDPELVQYLVEHQIPIEVCPTSNLCLGVYPSYQEHSLKKLSDAGVIFTINSDDPPMFNTTLTDEYLHAINDCGISLNRLEQSILDGIRVSYLPEKHKLYLMQEFQVEMMRLFAEHKVIH